MERKDLIEEVLTELHRMYTYYDSKRLWAASKIAEGGNINYYVAVVKIVSEVLKNFKDLIEELENGK